jgi:protein arginine kinase activator
VGVVGDAVKKVNVVVGHLSPTGAKGGTRCPQCGTSYKEFRKQGRFGCATCYEAFAPHLVKLFKRIHGAQVHTGKGPARQAQPQDSGEELSQLKQKLREAVAEEAYERAAALRDRISSTEAEEGE